MAIQKPEKRTETESHPQSPDSSENPSHSDPHKKTRDLPNLTECHACGFKIDVCTGKNKLRPLYSEWRIVLLCNKCFCSIESSQICSYCFSGTSSDSLRCIKCKHSVHKSCFHKYKNVAPWSYSCVGSEFSVCVDCWVPRHMEISRRKLRSSRKIKSGMIEKKGRVNFVKESSRVLRGGNLIRSVEDVVKEAKNVVKKKVEAAARAREVATKRAVAARRAIELANNALSFVANRKESTLNLPPKIDPVKVVRRSYLASDLHLNSPARISKTRCLLDTSFPKKWTLGIDSPGIRSNSRNGSGSDNKLSSGSSDSDSSTDLSCPCMGRSDMMTCPKNGVCTAEYGVEEIGEVLLKEGEERFSDRLINFSGEDSALNEEERSDRYFLKYSRRRPDCFQLKYSRRSDRYILKYSRRKSDRYFFIKYSRRNCLKPKLNS